PERVSSFTRPGRCTWLASLAVMNMSRPWVISASSTMIVSSLMPNLNCAPLMSRVPVSSAGTAAAAARHSAISAVPADRRASKRNLAMTGFYRDRTGGDIHARAAADEVVATIGDVRLSRHRDQVLVHVVLECIGDDDQWRGIPLLPTLRA